MPPHAELSARCRMCGSQKIGEPLRVREMMFGTRREFDYIRCAECGSLSQCPADYDPSEFYPPDYYSFSGRPPTGLKTRIAFGVARALGPAMTAQLPFLRSRYAPHALAGVRGELELWLGKNVAQKKLRILDVGCGSGECVALQRLAGHDAEGLDPFFTGPPPSLFQIHRKPLRELEAPLFDLITFRYSLEHTPQPLAELEAAFRLLKSGGACVAALPKLPCAAFTEYRECWYNLDAPRHYFIPTAAAVRTLAHTAGFAHVTVYDVLDRNEFFFSEAYRRGISMREASEGHHFSAAEKKALHARAEETCARGESGRAHFILQKAG